MTTTYNVNIAGSLTNNNGILSGFSGSNYASFARPTFNNTFEIGAKVTTGSNVSDLQIVYCPDTDQHGVRFEISGGKFGLLAGANGVWINTSSYTGGSVSANTPYFLKASYNGSTYKLEVSTDNVNYSTVVSYNSSIKVTNGFTNYLLGTFLDHNLGIFGGTIDLNYCYIKIDDNLVWEGSTVTPEPTGTTPKIGSNDISKIYLGSEEISKIYLGDNVVYENQDGGSGGITFEEDNTFTNSLGLPTAFDGYSPLNLPQNLQMPVNLVTYNQSTLDFESVEIVKTVCIPQWCDMNSLEPQSNVIYYTPVFIEVNNTDYVNADYAFGGPFSSKEDVLTALDNGLNPIYRSPELIYHRENCAFILKFTYDLEANLRFNLQNAYLTSEAQYS